MNTILTHGPEYRRNRMELKYLKKLIHMMYSCLMKSILILATLSIVSNTIDISK